MAATALVAALETAFRLDNASAVYLLAVVAIAIRLGTAPAIATAIGAFLVYNFALRRASLHVHGGARRTSC